MNPFLTTISAFVTTTTRDLRETSPTVASRADKSLSDGNKQFTLRATILSLLLIVGAELIAFGISLKEVGVYMDEWIIFGRLHFVADQSLLGLWSDLWADPRVIVRPLEAFHYGTIFYLVKEKPLLYHLSNVIFETAAACMMFLAVRRLFGNASLALASTLLFVVYPSRDDTHYSIVASSIPLSMALFTASLWQFVRAIQERSNRAILVSALLFGLSIYNYELCLPLIVLFPAISLALRIGDLKSDALRTLMSLSLQQLPFVTLAASFILFRSYLLPSLGLGWNYSSSFNLQHFLGTIGEGFKVTLSPHAYRFFAGMACDYVKDAPPFGRIALLCLSVPITIAVVRAAGKNQPSSPRRAWAMVALGLLTIVAGYSIYGLAQGYTPLLDNCINRINTTGSLGGSLVVAALLWLIAGRLAARHAQLLFSTLTALLVGLFVLADWEFAKPWIVSWSAQKQIQETIKSHAAEIEDGDSIIIADFPRYVRWCPVFDGTWDFQSTIRTMLNKPNIGATAVSERLHISSKGLTDRAGDFVCGQFPYERMILFAPLHHAWQRISTEKEFWDFARKHKIDLSLCKIDK